jgi:hypothetical protein
MERDEADAAGSETWVESLARDPDVREELEHEVLQVAEEVAVDFAGEEAVGPDEEARTRFRAFARRALDDS